MILLLLLLDINNNNISSSSDVVVIISIIMFPRTPSFCNHHNTLIYCAWWSVVGCAVWCRWNEFMIGMPPPMVSCHLKVELVAMSPFVFFTRDLKDRRSQEAMRKETATRKLKFTKRRKKKKKATTSNTTIHNLYSVSSSCNNCELPSLVRKKTYTFLK